MDGEIEASPRRREPGPPDGEPLITVREAHPDEHAALGELTVAAYRQLPVADDDPDHEAYLEEIRDVAARARHCTIYAAVDQAGRVLGGVTYVPGPGTPFSEGERDGEAGFRMLAVDPSAQGRGVGRALVEACVERARDDGRTGLVLLTLPSMVSAHRLYERLGFVRTPERDWEFAPGFVLRCYVLELQPGTAG